MSPNAEKENKKKKRVAPLPKKQKEQASEKIDKVEESVEDEFDFTDDMLAEVFGEISTPGNPKEEKKKPVDIDLDDWIPAALRPKMVSVKRTETMSSMLTPAKAAGDGTTPLQASQKKTYNPWPNASPIMPGTSLNASGSSTRKDVFFSSLEFEEDSTLRLRFLKRDVPASKVQELGKSAQLVPLTGALKFSDSKPWFTFGVVTESGELKKAGSGRIDLTDLSAEPYFVRFLIFNSAFSDLGKVPVGTILCISNPTKAKPYNGKEAMVVNDVGQILKAGMSRDYGLCSGKKKAGGACRAVVNLKICRYCRFHAMAEYKQQRVSKDLKAAAAGVGFGNKPAATGGLWNAKATLAPCLKPAKRNVVQLQKDKERLNRLNASSALSSTTGRGTTAASSPSTPLLRSPPPGALPKFDLDQLRNSVSGRVAEKRKFDTSAETCPTSHVAKKPNTSEMNVITVPVRTPPLAPAESPTQRMSAAKKKALQFVRDTGGIAKETVKTKNKDKEPEKEKPTGINDEFLALMKEKPRDAALLDGAEALERDKRFERLKVVEEIGEKLVATHEVPVRAIRCLVCKKNFHQMPLQCVMNKHGCRVVTGTKRFFECNGCRTRTTTLERLPTAECTKCGVWSWKRAGVAADRICSVAAQLCVRGMEEKFMGSIVNDPNLSLLVPDE